MIFHLVSNIDMMVIGVKLILLVALLPCIGCQVYLLEGQPETGYYLSVNLGTPPQEFKVLIDSGSSNFAVAAKSFDFIRKYPHFDKSLSSTFRDINREVGVKYLEGSWSGRVGEDIFSFASDIYSNASKGVNVYVSLIETASHGFFKTSTGWVGILGMGYAALSKPDSNIVPVMDSLVEQGVTSDKFGLQLCQPDDNVEGNLIDQGGRMSLGSGAPLLPSSSDVFKYVAVIEKSFYKVILTDIKVDGTSLDLSCTVFNQEFSIVDSGTTELLFNNRTFSAIIKALKATLSGILGNIRIPDSFWNGKSALGWKRGSNEEFDSFKNLEISLQVPNTQEKELSIVIPPQLYLKKINSTSVSLEEDNYCATTNCTWYKLGIKETSAPSVSGSILGMMLFKGYTVEFDRGAGKIGFAPSACKVTGLDNPSQVLKVAIRQRDKRENCEYFSPTHALTPLEIVICLIVGGVALAMFLLIGVGVCCLLRRRNSPSSPNQLLSTSNRADLESMLLKNSSSESEGSFGSDNDLVIK